MSLPFGVLVAALLPTAFVHEIPDSVRTEDTITIAEARNRLIANRGERIFFRTQGTIIAQKHGTTTDFILLDKTAATSTICSCDDPWRVGDEIVAICTAMQPQYRNPTLISEVLEIRVVRHQAPSVPRFIHPVDLGGHRNDFQLVCIDGVVTDAFCDDVNPLWTILVLAKDDTQTLVWTRTGDLSHRRPETLLDAEMHVTGIVLPDLCNFYRTQGPWVLASSSDSIQVSRPQPERPFDAQARPPHRQLVSGRVVACWQGDSFFLSSDDDRRIRVRLVKGESLPAPGDRVTVAGFMRHNEFGTRLSNARCRIETREHDVLETPVKVDAMSLVMNETGEKQVDTRLNGRTVRLSGLVQEQHASGTDRAVLALATGRTPLNVWIGPDTQMPDVGSVVEVVGACLVEDAADLDTGIVRATGIAIALRTTDGLRVLAAPPWWTTARFVLLVSLLLLVLTGILVWNAVLRKIVARRSRELARETIRSTSATLRLEERTRLAVELHDTIAQNLTGASFEVKTVARLAETNPDKMKEHLAIVDRTLKSCRDDIRNCIWDLRTNSLEQKDLSEAIRLALDPHTGPVGLHIRFNVARSRISDPTLHALMRILRELTINAIRHGRATRVWIAGSVENRELAFSVRDDGCGFDVSSAPGPAQGHFGLQGVRERVRKLDGSLQISSAPDSGTRVIVRLKLIHPSDSFQS